MSTARCFELSFSNTSGHSGITPDTMRIQEIHNIARNSTSVFPPYFKRIDADNFIGLSEYNEDVAVECFGYIPPSANFNAPYRYDMMMFRVQAAGPEGLGALLECQSNAFGSSIIALAFQDATPFQYPGLPFCGGVVKPPDSCGNDHFMDGAVCPRCIPLLDTGGGPALPRDTDPLGRDLTATSDPFRGGIYYRERNYTSPITMLTFDESPSALMGAISRGRGSYTLPNGYVVQGVQYAGLDPNGSIYGGDEHFGNADGQIPLDFQRNSVDTFNSFPAVFVRRASYLRSVATKAKSKSNWLRDPQIGTLTPQPFRLLKLANPIESSEWLLSIDGAVTLVTVKTQASDSLFTIAQVWNKVFAPMLTKTGSAFSPQELETTFFVGRDGGDGDTDELVTALSKIQFLEYARCLRVNERVQYERQYPRVAPFDEIGPV